MASAAFRATPSHDFVAGAVLLKRGSLAENVRFGSPDLGFWRGLAENARFESLELQFLRM